MIRLACTVAAVCTLGLPANAGGYVAPLISLPPIAEPPPAMPFDPWQLVAGSLIVMALLAAADNGPSSRLPVPPVVPEEPEPAPVPLPPGATLLGTGLGVLALLRQRSRKKLRFICQRLARWWDAACRVDHDLQFPGSGWVGHDPDMPPEGYGRGTALLDRPPQPARPAPITISTLEAA